GGEISDMGGLGDALHWCRMVPYLAPHCPDVTIAVRRPLVRLFSRLGLPVVAYADVVPGNFSALASCLWAFLPPRVRLPPLHAMALPPLWCDDSVRLPEQDGCLRVGLCWHGSGGFSGDSRCVDDWRCVPPSALTPLLSLR